MQRALISRRDRPLRALVADNHLAMAFIARCGAKNQRTLAPLRNDDRLNGTDAGRLNGVI